MRVSNNKINSNLKKQIIEMFAQTISDLKDSNEAKSFLKDFFTPSELESFSKRLAVSYWLNKKRTYENIKNNLKVSSATVAEMSETTKKEGIKLALKKIEAEEWASKWAGKIKKITQKIS